MKKLFVFLFTVLLPIYLTAQNKTVFAFEESTLPSDFSAPNGTLSLSAQYYKEGLQSLCWETEGQGERVMEVSTREFQTSGLVTYLQLRSPEITNDELRVEFLSGDGVVQRVANLKINFKGWREFIRGYEEYSTSSSFSLAKVRFILKPSQSDAKRKLYFDDMRFNSPKINKNFGSMWVLDQKDLKSDNYLFNLFANPIDIPVTTPSDKELQDLDLLRKLLPRAQSASTSIIAARGLANSYKIVRNSDGSVTGKPLDCSLSALTTNVVNTHLNALETLASRSSIDVNDSVLLVKFVDHLIEQGFAEGTNFKIVSSSYGDARFINSSLLNIAAKLPNDSKIEILKLVRWLSEYGTVYYPEDQYLSEFNSDLIYNYLPHMYGYALLQPDNALAIRELKALKRYLERHTEVVPGNSDMIKIDGTGFHHSTHYNNYMYAYKTWVEYVCKLKNTSFNINAQSYIRLREAVLATYIMANKNTGGVSNHFWANSLSGRNPYTKGGVNIQVPLSNLEALVEAGGTILGTPIDEELAAAYNYFTATRKYDVKEKSYDGYYQYNYSPLGIYRKNNWVVAMRAPTSQFWGAEIYSGQNRFGRYQSHGSLEVVYSGAYACSGIPMTSGSAGWDWNVIPGTTTVHYKSWQDMSPGKNTTQRFDQKTKGSDFSGSLAFGDCGLFATNFVQDDSWGSQVLTPTNLKFKKSVFTFDSIFVALGSDIASSGSYGTDLTTATNLFQEVKSDYFKDLIVDGTPLPEANVNNMADGKSHWVLTPLSTGYIIPKGNDNLVVSFASQTTPDQNGSDIAAPKTAVIAAKAYLNHGVQPSAGKYSFVMVPATSQSSMSKLAGQIADDGGEVYEILSQTSKLHAVNYKMKNITGYSFFEPVSGLAFGDVIATTNEHLLMVKKETTGNKLHFAIANPNLNPLADSRFGFISVPVTTKLTVRGKWMLSTQTKGIDMLNIVSENTEISITMSEGMPEYFTLEPANATSLTPEIARDQVKFLNLADQIVLKFSPDMGKVSIRIYTIDGRSVKSHYTDQPSFNIEKSDLTRGLYVLNVQSSGFTKSFKIDL